MRIILTIIFSLLIGGLSYRLVFIQNDSAFKTIIDIVAVLVSFYAIYKNSFKLQMIKENIFLRFKKVDWSADGIIEIENNYKDSEIIENIYNSIKDKYKKYRISNKGENYLDLYIHGMSLISIHINKEYLSKKIEISVSPFMEYYNSYKDILNRFNHLIYTITTKFSIIKENYTLKLDFDKEEYNPYYKILRSTFKEAKLSEMDISVKLQDTNDIEVLVGKKSFTFNFIKLFHVEKEIEKALKLSLRI